MTDHARSIEAGERALDEAIRKWQPGSKERLHRVAAKACIEAAIASGALVPAAQLAAERERCACFFEESDHLVWSNDEVANALRALEPAPASGEYVVVPRSALTVLMDKTEYLDDEGPRDEGWQSDELMQARKDIGAAMLDAATKDGSGNNAD